MLGGIWQLLFNPFHDLPEGGSVEGVGIPATPHNLIPAQKRSHKQFDWSTVITSSFFCVFFLSSLPSESFNTCSVLVILVKSQMQQEEGNLLLESSSLLFPSHTTSLRPTKPSLLLMIHISVQEKLTFHWAQTLGHPFCILLLLVCRTWRPPAYQDKDCSLWSKEIFSYIIHLWKHTDSQKNTHKADGETYPARRFPKARCHMTTRHSRMYTHTQRCFLETSISLADGPERRSE